MNGYLSMRSRTRTRQNYDEQLHNTGHTVTFLSYYSKAREKKANVDK